MLALGSSLGPPILTRQSIPWTEGSSEEYLVYSRHGLTMAVAALLVTVIAACAKPCGLWPGPQQLCRGNPLSVTSDKDGA